jgi:hypothetical protein
MMRTRPAALVADDVDEPVTLTPDQVAAHEQRMERLAAPLTNPASPLYPAGPKEEP